MPNDPPSSIGLRPTLSTMAMAISVTRTLVTEVMTVIVSESDSLNPTERHRLVE